jgi:hypothetical protein
MADEHPQVVAPTKKRVPPIWIAGLIIGLLALGGAVLSPWAAAAIDPPAKPIDEVATDMAVRIKDRMAAKAKGQAYQAPENRTEPSRPSDWYFFGVVAAGLLAVAIGVIGLATQSHRAMNATTVTIGAAAIVFQYALLLAVLLILILLVVGILNATGVI